MDSVYASKRYEASFKKFLAKNIDNIKMALMIYGVRGNEKRGICYVKLKNSMFKPKPKENVIKPKALYSHFTHGHTHDTYFAQKPWVDKTSRKTNHKGPKKTRVPKN